MYTLNRRKRSVVLSLAVAAALVVASPSFADMSSGSWYLDQSNTFSDGQNYGQVDILADSIAGTVQFTVNAFNVQPEYGPLNNFGIDKFAFNFANLTSTPSQWSTALPASWSSSPPPPSPTMDGFGAFLVSESGTGSTRQDPLVFTITLPTASEAIASNFAVLNGGGDQGDGFLFAAHVAGFTSPVLDDNREPFGSHFIAGGDPVPAPGAALLGILGMGAVGLVRRRLA